MYKVTITNIPVKYKLMNSVTMMVNIQALTLIAAEVDLHNGGSISKQEKILWNEKLLLTTALVKVLFEEPFL